MLLSLALYLCPQKYYLLIAFAKGMDSLCQWVNRSCPLASPTSGAQMSCVINIWSHSGEREF